MGILEDIEQGLGIASAPTPDVAPPATMADQYYGNDTTGDAAQPLTSAAEQLAQSNAYVPPATPAAVPASVPGWTTLHIQQDLNQLGASPQLAEDNKPGPATTAAIKAFQAAHSLPQTGIVDAATQNAIVLAMGIQVDVPPGTTPAPPATVTPATPPAPKPAPAPAPTKKPVNVKAILAGVGGVSLLGVLAAAASHK